MGHIMLNNKIRADKKKLGIIAGIVFCYLVMITIMFFSYNIRCEVHYIPKKDILFTAMIQVLILMFIPYEKLIYFFEKGFLDYFKIVDNLKKIFMYALVILVYAIVYYIKGLLHYNTYQLSSGLDTYTVILNMLVVYVLISSFNEIKNNFVLIIFDFLILAGNIYMLSDYVDNYNVMIVEVTLVILWCIFLIESSKKHKIISVLSFLVLSFSHMTYYFINSDLYKYFKGFYIGGYWKTKHNFTFSDNSYSLYDDFIHDLLDIKYSVGLWALIMFIMTIVILGILAAYTKKILSLKRHQVLLSVFMIYFVYFIYTVFADLYLLPPISASMVHRYNLFLSLAMMIRLFINRKIPESYKLYFSEHSKSEEDDDIWDAFSEQIDFLYKKDQRAQEEIVEIIKYLFYLEEEREIRDNYEGEELQQELKKLKENEKWKDYPKSAARLLINVVEITKKYREEVFGKEENNEEQDDKEVNNKDKDSEE